MANTTSTQAQTWAPTPSEDTPQVEGRRLIIIMVSVLLGILLAALDQTIVGPALPKIIGELQGFDHYSWVVTMYLLTSTISVPIFGKLSDMYGRKWFYVAGIAVFILGSALSGLSSGTELFTLFGRTFSGLTVGMTELILFRGLQGLGAGILFASAFAIIADLIPPRDRGKWQGVFGGVWGLAAVIGPTVGGRLTDDLSWRWVFYVNVPIGLVALAVLITTFPHERKHNVKKVVDWAGAVTLVASLTPLLLALSLGGTNGWDWGSAKILGMFAAALAFTVIFLVIESRAKEPILPLDLFKNSIFVVSTITVFVTGMGLFGAVIYIPLFIQAIQGDSATSSGNSLTPMMISLVIASVISGQILSRTGKYRVLGIIGMALVTLGMFLLYTMNIDTPRFTTISYMILMGLGMGITFPLYTLVVQNAFPMNRVGVVTATVQFFRSIGSTVGTAVLGSLVINQFHDKFAPNFVNNFNQFKQTIPPQVASNVPAPETFLSSLSNLNPQVLVGKDNLAHLQTQLVQHGTPPQFAGTLLDLITKSMKPALFTGIQEAFLIGAVLMALGLVATIFLKEIPLRKTNERPGAAMAEGGAGGWEPQLEEAGKELVASGMPASSLPARDEPTLTRK